MRTWAIATITAARDVSAVAHSISRGIREADWFLAITTTNMSAMMITDRSA
jgi:hypothetical protein